MKRIAHPKPLSADEILTDATNIIARHLPDARIFPFGSRAKGDARWLTGWAGSKTKRDGWNFSKR